MSANFLIVDDSALARRLTRNILEAEGHSVTEAADGVQALEKYAVGQFEFVILDLVMPGMSGLEVLAHLRQLNPTARVLVVSADIQKTTRDEVRQGGAVGILNKPVDRAQLVETLERVAAGETIWN